VANRVEIVVVAKDNTGTVFNDVRAKAQTAGKDAGEGFGREAEAGVKRTLHFDKAGKDGGESFVREAEGAVSKIKLDKPGRDGGQSFGREASKGIKDTLKGAEVGAKLGADVGESAVKGFQDAFDGIPGVIKTAVYGGLGIAAAAGAPLLAAAISGAVIGGAGIGGVVGGFMLVKNNPAIVSATNQLGADIRKSLTLKADVFVGPFLQAVDVIDHAFIQAGGNIQRFFNAAATWVTPLADAFGSILNDVSAGLADMLSGAGGPVLTQLTEGLKGTGEAIKSVFEDLSNVGPEAAAGLNVAFGVLNGTIVAVGKSLAFLASAYGTVMNAILGVLPSIITEHQSWLDVISPLAGAYQKTGGAFKLATDQIADATRTAAEAASAGYEAARDTMSQLEASIKGVADQAEGAKTSLQGMADVLRAQTDPTFALIEAQNRLKDAQDKYNEAVKNNGANSEEAKSALLDVAQAAIGLQGAVNDAAGTFDGHLTPAMRATLEAAGLTKPQIDALERAFQQAQAAGAKFAKKYQATVAETGAAGTTGNINKASNAGKAFAKKYTATVAVNGTGAAINASNNVAAAVKKIPNYKTVTINIVQVGSAKVSGMATGGVVAAESTVMRPRKRGIAHAAEGGVPGSAEVLVGEQGPEVVRLPYGASVTPAGATRALLEQAPPAAGPVKTVVEFTGNVDSMFATYFQKAMQAGLIRIKAQYLTA